MLEAKLHFDNRKKRKLEREFAGHTDLISFIITWTFLIACIMKQVVFEYPWKKGF